MPLYEYVCKDCESDFEVFHRSFNTIKPVSCIKKIIFPLMVWICLQVLEIQ